jgi:lantibiotic modifying enzyme
LIARALWQSFVDGHNHSDCLHNLAAAFRRDRLDPRHPYLAPGSTFETISPAIRAFCFKSRTGRNGEVKSATREWTTSRGLCLSPLDAAVLIGRSLCQAAHWDKAGRLCNWVGRYPLEATSTGAILPAASALGPELYAGSAGVALFLGQLHALTGDAECCRIALGAIARSAKRIVERPGEPPAPLSLFLGRLGVAYTAHCVAALTGRAELHCQAEALLHNLENEIGKPHPLDLIAGNAGAIPALLALNRDLRTARQSERHQALAIALGEELTRKAVRKGDAWAWATENGNEPGAAPALLTGMSHGASGIAVALLELYAVTGRLEFLEAARGAMAYEDSLFNPIEGNWPDLRATHDSGEAPGSPCYLRVWCHGAPGIALARLRAATLDPEQAEAHLAMARAAVSTTLRAVDEHLQRPGHDASLCHGLAGLLETLLCAGRQLGDTDCLERAAAVARVLIDRHGQSCDYPSGLICGSVNPSLMLGLAGTGYAFLRLHAPAEVPSILLMGSRGP